MYYLHMFAVFCTDIANDRIIDAHVKNLRKKLPLDYIETVIGLGYRWRKEDEIRE